MKKETYKQYNVILIGKDGFRKEMLIRYPIPQIFIPKIENVSCFLGEPLLLDKPVADHRIFSLVKDKCWKDILTYQEF